MGERPQRGNDACDDNLYRTIARELPHGAVFVVDRQLRYVLADGAELKMAGYTSADFEGKTVRDMVPAALADQYEQDYRTVLNGGTFSREHEVNQRHYHSYGMPLTNRQGEPELALVVSYDISERIRGERQLGVLGELATIAQSTADCASIVDEVNALLCRHLGPVSCLVAEVAPDRPELAELSDLLQQHGLAGQQPLSALGTACLEALHLGRAVAAPPGGQAGPGCELLDTLGMRSFVLIPQMRDGRLAGLFAIGRPVPRSWRPDDLALAHTVAERTWSAIERSRALAALQASDRHKNQILALLGHELRNPASTLSSGISLLKRCATDANAQKALALMERQVSQINRMVEDLLGISYVYFGKLELRLEDVALDELVETVLDTLRPVAARKRQQLLCTAHGAHLLADPTKLMQVLTNLIGNAIKYTPNEGRIVVAVREDGGQVVVQVEDDGIGMSAPVMSNLFELFVRGTDHHGAGAAAESGLGIGLWVVKQFVDAHQGAITVASPGNGLGSTFTVTLPKAGPSTA
jgi:PAS domain S-box-containing protein